MGTLCKYNYYVYNEVDNNYYIITTLLLHKYLSNGYDTQSDPNIWSLKFLQVRFWLVCYEVKRAYVTT